MVRERAAVMAAAFVLDGIMGDPAGFPHPVRGIGTLIASREKALRGNGPKTEAEERAAGRRLVLEVLSATFAGTAGVLALAKRTGRTGYLVLETLMCAQMLAAKSLMTESRKVYRALVNRDTEKAREAVSMIVGRDTEPLTREGIIKAAVETVAENTSDGVTAPLFYMAVGGVPLMFLYKAINTMDSMVGYQNDRYLYFGRCAARLDDGANLIPSRLSGILMVPCARLCGLDHRGAWRIFLRDRLKHKSPNSAHTEAACAGALGLELAGDAFYFGKLCPKPAIGDRTREAEPEDIMRANRLMYTTAGLTLGLSCLALWVIGGKPWQRH